MSPTRRPSLCVVGLPSCVTWLFLSLTKWVKNCAMQCPKMAAWNRVDPQLPGVLSPAASNPTARIQFIHAIAQGDVPCVSQLATQLPVLASASIADGGLHALYLAASSNQVCKMHVIVLLNPADHIRFRRSCCKPSSSTVQTSTYWLTLDSASSLTSCEYH